MNPAVHAQPTDRRSGAGAVDPRQARIDQRRAFVATKVVFMDACVDLAGTRSAQLTRQVRDATVPSDLWALLPALLAALPPGAACTTAHAEALARHLESLAPEDDVDTSYAPI